MDENIIKLVNDSEKELDKEFEKIDEIFILCFNFW